MAATVTAVVVSMGLGLAGLEFTPRQWLLFWACVPAATVFFTSIDVLVIRSHLRPLSPVLSALDAGRRPDDATLAAAVVRALNLPQMSAVRVTLLHGPMATLSLCAAVYTLKPSLAAKMPAWWTPIPDDVVQAIDASPTGQVPYSDYESSFPG